MSRSLGEPLGAAEKGLLLEGSQGSPVHGFIFCSLATPLGGLSTKCWKDSRAEPLLLRVSPSPLVQTVTECSLVRSWQERPDPTAGMSRSRAPEFPSQPCATSQPSPWSRLRDLAFPPLSPADKLTLALHQLEGRPVGSHPLPSLGLSVSSPE